MKRRTGRDWERLVLSRMDPFKVRVIVKYTLVEEHEKRTGDYVASGSPELAAIEQETDRVCERYFARDHGVRHFG